MYGDSRGERWSTGSAPCAAKGNLIIRHVYYALATVIVLLLEIAIALVVHDRFVRPYLGDTLAVVLVYCGIRTVTPLGVHAAAAGALAIACAVEFGQWIDYVDRLGLGHVRWARIVLGTGFDWHDLIAYSAGALAILLVQALRIRMSRRHHDA
jgi:hypothetical protein